MMTTITKMKNTRKIAESSSNNPCFKSRFDRENTKGGFMTFYAGFMKIMIS